MTNASSMLEPLNRLLHSDVKWSWGEEQETDFKDFKQALLSPEALVHCNPTLP